jgi:hypothetical protein
MCVAAVEADSRQAKLTKFTSQPGRRSTTLQTEALESWSLLAKAGGDHLRVGGYHALENNRAGVIDDADRRLLQRNIKTSIDRCGDHSAKPVWLMQLLFSHT